MELFVSEDRLKSFLARVVDYPTLSYQAVRHDGETRSNLRPDAVSAVTWGVFPGKEIIQPTVVDAKTFLVWKDEAFGIWRDEWATLYLDDSPSRRVLEQMHDAYWLMHVIENDYHEGDIFAIFRDIGVLD